MAKKKEKKKVEEKGTGVELTLGELETVSGLYIQTSQLILPYEVSSALADSLEVIEKKVSFIKSEKEKLIKSFTNDEGKVLNKDIPVVNTKIGELLSNKCTVDLCTVDKEHLIGASVSSASIIIARKYNLIITKEA